MIDESAFIPDLLRWEGAVRHMYRDSEGYVTVGVGNLVHAASDAAKLPFELDGLRPATAREVGDDFLRVISMSRGQPASAYRSPRSPHIELTDDGVQDLLRARLRNEFIPGLERICKGFDSFPAPAQSALVDIAFNCGLRGIEQFGHMLAAIDRRDWTSAAASCHRRTSRQERNEWTRDKFLEAAG